MDAGWQRRGEYRWPAPTEPGERSESQLPYRLSSSGRPTHIYDKYDVREGIGGFFRVKLATDKLRIVFLDVARAGIFHDLVPVLHLDAKRVEGCTTFLGIGDDGLLTVGQLGTGSDAQSC